MLSNEQIAIMKRRRYRSSISMGAIENIVKKSKIDFDANKKIVYSTPLLKSLTQQTDNIYVNPANIGSTPTQTIVNALKQNTQTIPNKNVSPLNNILNAIKGNRMYFSMEDYLNAGSEKHTKQSIYNENPEHYKNAEKLLSKVNKIGEFINTNATLSSGYRTRARQAQIYREQGKTPILNSLHSTGHAIDIKDPDGKIKQEIKSNKKLLEKAKQLGLYFENFKMTPTWVHIQDVAPGFTGNEIWSADNFLNLLN